MKTSCGNINIFDVDTIFPWIFECLCRHRKRYDFKRLIIHVGGLTKLQYQASLTCAAVLIEPAKQIAEEAIRRIKAKDLNLKPIVIKHRVDRSNGKQREIGCEDAMQQIFDAIAVGAAEDIFNRRVVIQQWSSIPKRGPTYGVKMIQKWIIKDNRSARYAKQRKMRYTRKCKFFVKLDIRHCYESISPKLFIRLFRKDCRNKALVWLWGELLNTFPNGLLIGSAVSQWAAQYILSFLYDHVVKLHSIRRGKKMKWVQHAGMYMDDILLISSNYKNLKLAVESLSEYANMFGLTIKSNWQICRLKATPIDMMGYLIYSDGKIAVRPRVFLRARRMFLRCRKTIAFRQAQRLCSYKGYFVQRRLNLSKFKLERKYRIIQLFHRAQYLISERMKSYDYRIQQRTI